MELVRRLLADVPNSHRCVCGSQCYHSLFVESFLRHERNRDAEKDSNASQVQSFN